MTLNYDLFFDLINFGIDNTSGNSLDSPLFYLVLLDVECAGEVIILVIGVLELQGAYLHVLLLAYHVSHLEFLVGHQLLELLHLGLELLRVSRREQGHEIEHLLLLALQVFHCLQRQDVREIDHRGHFNSQNNATLGLMLYVKLRELCLCRFLEKLQVSYHRFEGCNPTTLLELMRITIHRSYLE